MLQNPGLRIFFNIEGQIEHLKNALETDHRGGKFDRGVGQALQGII